MNLLDHAAPIATPSTSAFRPTQGQASVVYVGEHLLFGHAVWVQESPAWSPLPFRDTERNPTFAWGRRGPGHVADEVLVQPIGQQVAGEGVREHAARQIARGRGVAAGSIPSIPGGRADMG